MGARSTAREAALQMLYALDTTGNDVERVIANFWNEAPGDPEGREYANLLVRGVAANLERTDALIESASQNWRVGRMSRVDRNVLRIGAWELAERLEVPRAVILDEAVETAKRFGNEDSGAFVNGVLDRIADDCNRHDTDTVSSPASASKPPRR